MASEAFFKNNFCPEIEREWKGKLSPTKAQIVWNSIKAMADEALKIALSKILRETSFPGVDKIIEYCNQENIMILKLNLNQAYSEGCSFCNSGVRTVNNFAYRCKCKLGLMLYPGLPEYNGQAPFQDKRYADEEGNEVLETSSHIYKRKPGSKNLRDFSFSIKGSGPSRPKQDFSKPKLVKADHFDMERF